MGEYETNYRVVIINTQAGDWEGIYIDGKLVFEGHSFFAEDKLRILKLAEKFNFKSTDIVFRELNNEDDAEATDYGCLADELQYFTIDYSSKFLYNE